MQSSAARGGLSGSVQLAQGAGLLSGACWAAAFLSAASALSALLARAGGACKSSEMAKIGRILKVDLTVIASHHAWQLSTQPNHTPAGANCFCQAAECEGLVPVSNFRSLLKCTFRSKSLEWAQSNSQIWLELTL